MSVYFSAFIYLVCVCVCVVFQGLFHCGFVELNRI